MRLYSNLITCLLVLASLPARPQWPAVHPEFRVSMDSLFRTLSGNQPGIAFSIGKGDAILYQNAAGVAGLTTAAQIDSTTNFRMASVTKQFTAMAILLLEKNPGDTENPSSIWDARPPARLTTPGPYPLKT